MGWLVFPGSGAGAATVRRIVSHVFGGEQTKTHRESAVNLAQINEGVERKPTVKDDVAGKDNELAGEHIELDLTGACAERVVPKKTLLARQ